MTCLKDDRDRGNARPIHLDRAVAFILLGASGTFLLLPHRHGLAKPLLAHRVGYALVGLAVVVFATFWRAPVELVTRFFFYAFGFASILGAILTVTNRNPIYSALWFASVVLATAGLFLLSGAQFLAAGTIIVYAGAIIVTFLFVIMLAQMEGRAIYDRTARSPFWATFSSFLLLFGLTYALLSLRPPRGNADTAEARVASLRRPAGPVSQRLDPPSRSAPIRRRSSGGRCPRRPPCPSRSRARPAAGRTSPAWGRALHRAPGDGRTGRGLAVRRPDRCPDDRRRPRRRSGRATHDAAANAGV